MTANATTPNCEGRRSRTRLAPLRLPSDEFFEYAARYPIAHLTVQLFDLPRPLFHRQGNSTVYYLFKCGKEVICSDKEWYTPIEVVTELLRLQYPGTCFLLPEACPKCNGGGCSRCSGQGVRQ